MKYYKNQKNNKKTISRKYYKERLWKITVYASSTTRFSIFKSAKNRLVKIYEKRNGIGENWIVINKASQEDCLI